jgi:hypothetical protein
MASIFLPELLTGTTIWAACLAQRHRQPLFDDEIMVFDAGISTF